MQEEGLQIRDTFFRKKTPCGKACSTVRGVCHPSLEEVCKMGKWQVRDDVLMCRSWKL